MMSERHTGQTCGKENRNWVYMRCHGDRIDFKTKGTKVYRH